MKSYLKFFAGMAVMAAIFAVFSFKPLKSVTEPSANEHLTMAVLYQQKSAEAKALDFQAYNYAKASLDEKLKDKKLKKKKKAVVVDIDETVLDNSPFEARCIIEGSVYPKYWKEWIELGKAKAIPGAVAFLNYANSKGVETFYISNRKSEFRDITLKNLKEEGFPNVDTTHLMLKNKENSKEDRRQKLAVTHEILLLIGDNMADFSPLFDNATTGVRNSTTESLKNQFGKKYIVLPNAQYGDWESALYEYNFKLTEKEKFEIRRKNLVSFE
jgi:5'-nucleotidase (lipoprotein e(P4) family)